jgi:hypothetical protein
MAWPVGRAMEGGDAIASDVVAGFVSTLLLTLVSVLLFAVGLYLLAPFFKATRSWNRSIAVSCYSATPVLLSGGLLFVPLLVIASVGAFLYALGLCTIGLRIVLECREDEVAGFLASAAVFMGVGSMAIGALCSAIGLI